MQRKHPLLLGLIGAGVLCCSGSPDLPPYITTEPVGPAFGATTGGASSAPDDAGAVTSAPGSLAITDGGVCAATVPTTLVTQQQVAAATPTPNGGTIVPGKYVLTSMNKYTGVTGVTGPTTKVQGEVIVLDSSSYQNATSGPLSDGGIGFASLESGNYTAIKTTFTESATCGIGNIPVSYASDGVGTLKLSFLNEEYVFTRQ
jgi:hypothetical protein